MKKEQAQRNPANDHRKDEGVHSSKSPPPPAQQRREKKRETGKQEVLLQNTAHVMSELSAAQTALSYLRSLCLCL